MTYRHAGPRVQPVSRGASPRRASATHVGPSLGVPVTGTLDDCGTFEGLLSITELAFEDGQLLASGTLTGAAAGAAGAVTDITQTFADVALGLTSDGPGSWCDILNMDLGPLNLDPLGLIVDLSPAELDVGAERGPGNLLGNLLCAVADLLDGGPTGGLSGLLDRINDLL